MKNHYKRNVFSIMGLCVILILVEIVTKKESLGAFGLGFLLICIGLVIKNKFIRRTFYLVGLTILVAKIITTWSSLLLLLTIVMFWVLFRTCSGNEFIDLDDTVISPFKNTNYHGVELIQPQSKQRNPARQVPLEEIVDSDESVYEWDDINIVMFGGNSIVDLGNTILPDRENNVIIQKMFGRTRIITSADTALKLNISAISGRVIFSSAIYDLTGENFRWKSDEYDQASRKLNVIVSVASGDVEVIML